MVSNVSSGSTSSTAQRTLSVTGGVQSGDLLIIAVSLNGASTDPQLPLAYTKIGTRAGNGNYLYYKQITLTATSFDITSTFDSANPYFHMYYILVRGINSIDFAGEIALSTAGGTTTYTKTYDKPTDGFLFAADNSNGIINTQFSQNQNPSMSVTGWSWNVVPVIACSFKVDNKYLFQDGEEIKKYISEYSPNLILNPATNGISISGGNAYASFPVPNAFDGYDSSYWSNSTAGFVLDITFPSSVLVNKAYVLGGLMATVSFKLECRQEDLTWRTLFYNASMPITASAIVAEFENTTAYKVYKITFYNNGTSTVSINTMALYSAVRGWQVVGSAPATKSMFDIDGMANLSPVTNSEIQELASATPEVLCWTDEVRISSDNITPIMTSNTTPSGIASSSSTPSNGTGQPCMAFDHSDSSGNWTTALNDVTGWLAYDFQVNKTIGAYAMSCFTSTGSETAMPKDWTFEGSNDGGISWTVLDTQINQTGWTAGKRNLYSISNQVSYSKYRLNISANNGEALIALSELEMMETILPSRTTNLTAIPLPQLLLPIGDIVVGDLESMKVDANAVSEYTANVIPIMTSNILPAPYKAEASSIFGAGYEAFKAFDSSLSTVWMSSAVASVAAPQWLSIDFSTPKTIGKYAITSGNGTETGAPGTFTFEGWDGLNWVVLDSRSGIVFLANVRKEFLLSSLMSFNKYRIRVTATPGIRTTVVALIEMYESLPGNTDIKLLASGDSGVSWIGKSPSDPAILTDVKANGFTPAEFNALTKEALATLFPAGKARFAFYLEQEKSTDTVQVNSLTINERQYTMTPSVESLSVLYELLQSEKPVLYVSRDDGVTWKQVQPDQLTKLDDLPNGSKLRVKAVLSNGQELHGLSYSWI
jgi:hypothetical protein